jgi:hypothetical protein
MTKRKRFAFFATLPLGSDVIVKSRFLLYVASEPGRLARVRFLLDSRTPASQQIDDEQYECDDQHDVDEAAQDMERQSEQPEDEQNDDDCPE